MPQAPLHLSDVPADGWEDASKIRAGSNHVIRDLLHRLDLHGDVEPIDDVRGRFWHRTRQPFEDFGAVGNHGHVAKAAIPFLPKRVKSAIPYRMLAGVAGGEIPAAQVAPPTTTAAGNNDLEISC